MASDISTVKSNISSEGVLSSVKGQSHTKGAGIDFAEIIRKSSSRMDGGLNALSDRAGITAVSERPEHSPAADDRSYDRGDDRNENPDHRANADDNSDRGHERGTTNHSDRANDYANDRQHDHKPDTLEASNDGQSDSHRSENRGENVSRDERSAGSGDENASKQDNAEDSAVAATDSDGGEQAAVKGDNAGNSNGANAGGNAHDSATASTAKQMLNSLLSNAQESGLPGPVAEKSQGNAQNGPGKANATEGLNMALSNVGKQAEGGQTNAAQTGLSGQNGQAQAQTHNLRNAQTTSQTQTQNNSLAGMQAVNETQVKETSKAAEQASQLSRMVGNGNKVDVSVSVTDEKATLVSKPSANLVSNTVLAQDSTTPSLRSQQAQGANNANGAAQAQQAAAQATGVAAQAQQAVQQAAATQSQTANTTAIDAKGGLQGNLHTAGTQGTLASNGETPVAAAPNSPSAAQQAQQNTSTQAANTPRFTVPNHAVADQVSVQINKALNAGNDRISIQLKPAELGRIDVQMEVGQDGRLMAVVTADNKSTLDLLQKDAKELQQALQQAGLQVNDESLSFNLREQNSGSDMAGNSAGNGGEEGAQGAGEELSLEDELAGLKRDIITDTRIDVSA